MRRSRPSTRRAAPRSTARAPVARRSGGARWASSRTSTTPRSSSPVRIDTDDRFELVGLEHRRRQPNELTLVVLGPFRDQARLAVPRRGDDHRERLRPERSRDGGRARRAGRVPCGSCRRAVRGRSRSERARPHACATAVREELWLLRREASGGGLAEQQAPAAPRKNLSEWRARSKEAHPHVRGGAHHGRNSRAQARRVNGQCARITRIGR